MSSLPGALPDIMDTISHVQWNTTTTRGGNNDECNCIQQFTMTLKEANGQNQLISYFTMHKPMHKSDIKTLTRAIQQVSSHVEVQLYVVNEPLMNAMDITEQFLTYTSITDASPRVKFTRLDNCVNVIRLVSVRQESASSRNRI